MSVDILLISCPMYNFGITSNLKAYFNAVARAYKTFKFTAEGPKGIVKNKKVFIITTRGGYYANHPDDQQTPFLNSFLKFLGIDDITFFYCEGLDMSPENCAKELDNCKKEIKEFIESY